MLILTLGGYLETNLDGDMKCRFKILVWYTAGFDVWTAPNRHLNIKVNTIAIMLTVPEIICSLEQFPNADKPIRHVKCFIVRMESSFLLLKLLYKV